MTKPILWLGPLDDMDAEFDPLLGRSAKDVVAQTPTAPSTPLAANRSVFDDLDTVPSQPVAPVDVEALRVPVVEEPVVTAWDDAPRIDDVIAEPDPIVEPVVEPLQMEIVAEVEPAPEPDVLPEPVAIDPVIQDDEQNALVAGAGPVPDATLPDEIVEEAPEPEAPEPAPEPIAQRSFFTNLFARKSVAPVAGAAVAVAGIGTAAVSAATDKLDDLWSKVDDAPDPVPEPELTPADTTGLSAGEKITVVDETSEVSEAAIVADESETIATIDAPIIEAEVPDVDSNTFDAPEPEQAPEQAPQPEPIPLPALNEEPVQDVSDTPEDTEHLPEPEPELMQKVAPQEEPALDIATAPMADAPLNLTGLEALEDVDKPEATLEAEPAIAEVGPEVVATAHPFSKAFNADKFWKIEKSPTDDRSDDLVTRDLEPAPGVEAPSSFVPELAPAPETEAVRLKLGPDDRPLGVEADDRPQNADLGLAPPPVRKRRRKKKVKKSYIGAFAGTFFFGIAIMMTLVSSLAAFGYPFDLMSSYRWYWVVIGVIAAAIFGVTRGWKMVIASLAVIGVNLAVTVPASGNAPVGGKTAAAVIGWANVNGNAEALARMFKDADAKQVTLMMVAEAPSSASAPPAGWTLIEAPRPNDPTAIATFAKGSWRAVTRPGEPTFARPATGDITIIGAHPQDANKRRRSTPERDALINRAGTRAGDQEGPTVVIGDFNAAPWDRAMKQFREYGKVTRVRCGGWAAGTYTQAFGLIGVATDHAFVRDVKVTYCQLGATLPGGPHRPIWLYITPQTAPPEVAPTQ